jgi:hypothetical protein
MRRILNAWLLALLFTASLKALPAKFQATNVVILIIDGARYTETWGDPEKRYIPELAGPLALSGTVHSNFWNAGYTFTTSGHTALCTGFYEKLENSKGSDLPSHPGIFQYFLAEKKLPAEQAWVITTKDKLAILANTTQADWAGKHMPSIYTGKNGGGLGSGYGEDAQTMDKVVQVLTEQSPRLMLINLKQPDAAGHTGDWLAYVGGLKQSDAYAAKLWKTLQSLPAYAGKTALFVTHDHGRHSAGVRDAESGHLGFVDHGDDCEGCRRLTLWALGPDFKQGAEVRKPAEQIDLPVTVAAILGFKMPGLKGRVLEELFP